MVERNDAQSASNRDRPAPKVSVIIPAYKAAEYIAAALHSVFAQTADDFEVIVINDGSPDTQQMELAIAPYLSRILYLKQENGGPSAARNLGIRHARGEWLAFLDSDDSWLPEYLAEQFRFLAAGPGWDMVFCDAALKGEPRLEGKTFMQLCPSNGPVTLESVLAEKIQPITSGTVIRRNTVVQAGLFDEAIHCSEDHDLWLRVLYGGARISYHRLSLLHRNVRSGSQGGDPAKLLGGEIQTLIKLDRQIKLSDSARAALQEKLNTIQAELASIEGKEFLLAGETAKARESLARANSLLPSSRLRWILLGLRVAPRSATFLARLRIRRKPA